MAKVASVQRDLEGNFVVRSTSSQRLDRFRQGAFEATVTRKAPEAVQRMMAAMKKATKPEADGGGKKYSDEQITDTVETLCENRVKVVKGTPKSKRLAEDRSGLVAELFNYLTTGEPPTVPKQELVRRSEKFSTDLFFIKLADGALDAKLTKWNQKLKKATVKAEKGKKGSKAREALAEVDRTIAGERQQWVQSRVRKLA